MRVLILTARPMLETNLRLAAAGRSLGCEVEVADATLLTACPGPPPSLSRGDLDLLACPPDAVVARIGNWRPESLLAALEVAVSAGPATPNLPESFRIARDHWRTVQRLAEHGVPVPETMAGADPESLACAGVARLGLPIVVKVRRSRMGIGVIRCLTRDHLESVLDSLWRLGDEVVLQRHLGNGNLSFRLLVAGSRVVAAARFSACEGEWRSNAARGGSAETHQPCKAEAALALEAAAVLGLGVCGVDLIETEAGMTVVEVNPTPGFVRLEDVSGVDVARAILEHVLSLV